MLGIYQNSSREFGYVTDPAAANYAHSQPGTEPPQTRMRELPFGRNEGQHYTCVRDSEAPGEGTTFAFNNAATADFAAALRCPGVLLSKQHFRYRRVRARI